MANYTKTTIGKENRIELHEKLSLTGAEISLNELPAGANVPFVHSHKENEEIYGILSGNGKAIIDGEEISLSTGDWLKIAPAAKRQFFCIRYFWNYLYLHSGKRKFSGTFYSRGCRNRLIKSIYLQKCTVHDKLRTVHFFFVQYYVFSIFQTRTCRGLVVYLIMAYTAKPRNGQDRSLQLILYCGANIQMICRAGCPHPAAEKPC